MRYTRRYGAATVIDFPVWVTTGEQLTTPTFAAGDVKISINGAAPVNTTNLPVAVGLGHTLTLTAAELTGARMQIQIADQDGPLFADDFLLIETFGNASAQTVGDPDNLDATVSSRASSAEIAALNNISTAEVKTQVNEVLNVDAKAELASRPAANAPLGDKLTWLSMPALNRYEGTDTTETLYADNDSTVVSTRPVTKTTSQVTKGKAV